MTDTSTEHSNHSGPLTIEQRETFNKICTSRSEFAGELLHKANFSTDAGKRLKAIQDQNRLA